MAEGLPLEAFAYFAISTSVSILATFSPDTSVEVSLQKFKKRLLSISELELRESDIFSNCRHFFKETECSISLK